MQTKIDYVITWVDGQNPHHKALRKFYLEQEKADAGGKSPNKEEQRHGFEKTTTLRFQDNGELYYNIASVLRYAPFIRKIFIVTDNQTPPLLQSFISEGKCPADFLQLVSHDEIFAADNAFPQLSAARPCFNSRSIEAVLWRINGLSEHFVFANDDFFFNAPACEQDFFTDGAPRICGKWKNAAQMQMRYAARLLLERLFPYTMPPSHSTSLWQGARLAGYYKQFLSVPHCPHPVRKSTFADFFCNHPDILMQQLQFRFRSPRQFNPVSLANHLEILKGVKSVTHTGDTAYLDDIKSPEHYAEILQKIRTESTRYACIQDMGLYPPHLQSELHRILMDKLQSTLPEAIKRHIVQTIHYAENCTENYTGANASFANMPAPAQMAEKATDMPASAGAAALPPAPHSEKTHMPPSLPAIPQSAKISAFILHLDRAAGRLPQAEKLCALLRQNAVCNHAEIIPAADALQLSDAQITAAYRRKIFYPFYPFALNNAEIACFLSHRKAWQAMLDQNCDAALIAEDDMQPQPLFSAALHFASENIQSCSLIRFPHRRTENGAVYKQASDGKIALLRPHRAGLGAVAYMLSRHAAAELLKISETFDRPVDVLLQMFWLTKIHPFSVQPVCISEISKDIGGSTLAQKHNLRQKIRQELLRPLYRAQIKLLSYIKQ